MPTERLDKNLYIRYDGSRKLGFEVKLQRNGQKFARYFSCEQENAEFLARTYLARLLQSQEREKQARDRLKEEVARMKRGQGTPCSSFFSYQQEEDVKTLLSTGRASLVEIIAAAYPCPQHVLYEFCRKRRVTLKKGMLEKYWEQGVALAQENIMKHHAALCQKFWPGEAL